MIVRSTGRSPLEVTLDSLQWLPLLEAVASAAWPVAQSGAGIGLFLDQPFEGTLAESLWRPRAVQRWRDPERRLERLRALVALAWRHCRGYRDWWSRHGWHPSDLVTLADAARIPVVTKDQIGGDLEAFSLPRRNALRASTTGSTGQPFTFRYTAALRAAHSSHVALAAAVAWPELSPCETSALVARGRPVRGLSATGSGGSLVVSPALFRQPDVLADLTRAYRPALLFGHPLTSVNLAAALGGSWRFRAAVLASEAPLPAQIQAIEEIADSVVATYGLAEGVAFALRCPSCGAYSETPSHALIGLRARADGTHDIVGTAFWALGTLFISYLTGDLTTGAVQPCVDCPAGVLHLADVRGRSQDTLVDRYGARHTLACVIGALAVVHRMGDVLLYDCVQTAPGRVLLRYASRYGRPIDERAIVAALRHVAPDLEFELRFEPKLPAMRDALPPGKKWKLVKTSA